MDLFDEKYSGGRKTVEKFTKKYFDNDKEIARALGINLELMFINNLDLIEKICKERESVLEI